MKSTMVSPGIPRPGREAAKSLVTTSAHGLNGPLATNWHRQRRKSRSKICRASVAPILLSTRLYWLN